MTREQRIEAARTMAAVNDAAADNPGLPLTDRAVARWSAQDCRDRIAELEAEAKP